MNTPTPRDLLGLGPIDIGQVAQTLSSLTPDARAAFVQELTKADMIRLWDATQDRPTDAADFVPPHLPAGTEVIHHGKNSLPLMSSFQKRFVAADGWANTVFGYNWTPLNWTTAGPGYFVGHLDPDVRGQGLAEFGLDYYQVPPAGARLPAGWPPVRKNELGLTLFIYAKMVDYMRKVSDGITIGRAYKHGKRTSNYFVLARSV